MKFLVFFAASAFLLALQGVRAAPLTQDLHSDASAYRSIIDQLLAVPDKRLCLVRQELDQKEKTEEVVSLLNYLDQRALELHGLSCLANLELSALSKQVSDSKFESEDSAPEAKLVAPFLLEDEEEVDEWKNKTQSLKLMNSARILIEKNVSQESKSGPEFEAVAANVASNAEELPCFKDCNLQTSADELSDSFSDGREYRLWRLRLAAKILSGILFVLTLAMFLLLLIRLFKVCCCC